MTSDRGWVRRAAIAFASTIVTTALVESMLRLMVPIAGCDEALTATFAQSIPGLQQTVTYERDSNGLRRDPPPPRDPDARMLCLGASTTDQATQSWPDTWCAKLARGLESESPGLVVESAAFGRGGMGITQSARTLTHLLDRFRADLVVILLGVNDVTWLRGLDQGSPADDPSPCSSEESTWWRRFELVRLAFPRTRRGTATSQTELEWHSAHLPEIRERFRALPQANPEGPSNLSSLASELDGAVAKASARGASVLLVGQPTLWKENLSDEELDRLWFPVRTTKGWIRAAPGWLASEMRATNDMQRELAARAHVAFVDLDPLIPKDLDHFFDDCHFTDRGSTTVAEALLPTATAILAERRATQARESVR